MPIPQTAIDRYLRLRHKSDDLFAARREAQEAWQHERNEVGRLDGHVQGLFPNRHIEIDAAGNVAQVDILPGQLRWVGISVIPDDGQRRKTALKLDAGTQHAVSLLLAARRRLAQADAHRQRLNATGDGLAQLAEECLQALLHRGWRPSGANMVHGSAGIIGVAR
jgi:hypothetical protein